MTRKTALITGASKRIGAHIALSLAESGWDIGLHYHASKTEAEKLADEIKALGRRCALLQADLSDAHDTGTLLQQCADQLAAPDLLINNASLFEEDHMGTLTQEQWDAHMNVNARAPALLSQAFAHMLPKGKEGLIINIIDQRVWKLTPHFVSYTASKSALWSLTRQMAQALAPHIRVNAIGPGPTLRGLRQTEADFDKQQAAVPLKKGGTPAQIASAVQFLLDQPAITGQMIAIDGGQHLAWQTPDIINITE